MEQAIRDRVSDPKIVKAAIQELRVRSQAQNAEQTEVAASNKATILGAFAKGADIRQLTATPAYLSLSGSDQEQLKSYMVNRSTQLDELSDSARSKRGFARYWELSSPTKLAAMSENQILALEPELGRSLVGDLMRQKRTVLKTEDQVRAATIDADLFNTIAADADLKPYDKDTDKATLGRLKSTVELEIERAQQKLNRALTRDEKRTIMQEVIDQKVMLDLSGQEDSERTVALLTADQRGKAYMPIARVPATFRREAISWMRSNGNARWDESETQVMNRFQRRLERAYAARITGATSAEIANILAGK